MSAIKLLYLKVAYRVYLHIMSAGRKIRDTNRIIGLFATFLFVLRAAGVDIFYLPPEPLGPSSRNTGLVISEIMYNYGFRADGRIIEYVEIYNTNPYPEDISGYKLSGVIDYTFPTNTILGPQKFLVVARNAADIQAVYGLTNVLSYGGVKYKTNVVSGITNIIEEQITLSGTGTLELKDRKGKVLLSVTFSNKNPWPAAADGGGHSLVLARPSYGENDYRAWTISDYRGGSPGSHDKLDVNMSSLIVINEICANPVTGERFIEIYNRTGFSPDLSGYVLTDNITKKKYQIPKTVHIPPYGRFSFPASMLGFSPGAMGETIYLLNPETNRVLDCIRYDPHPAGLSWGRYPDGADGIFLLSIATPGASNAPIYRPEVVINEIMYAPISGDSDDEYIELFNRSTNIINLGGWQLQGGINFLFTSNTVINPNDYLVVARNMTNLYVKYGKPANLCCGKMVGNYSGSLRNTGEQIALAKPFVIVTIDDQTGAYKTNNLTVPVDEILYGTGGKWGKWSRNGGSSLELTDPNADSRFGLSWADSYESDKADWFMASAAIEMENGFKTTDELQIYLDGAGECLIDDVEVRTFPFNVNQINNSYFESGLNYWEVKGNHSGSMISNNGYLGTKCLHLISTGKGDFVYNHVSTKLASPLPPTPVRISIRARWLAGSTNLLVRFNGNTGELRIGLPVPNNTGTPGAMNTTFATNAGPAISEIRHSPVTPAANEDVTVTAKIDDPDGISSVKLYYRIDPATNYFSLDMNDDGNGIDKYKGDGIYSALLPGQPANTLIAFYIVATDNSGEKKITIFPNPNDNYECYIRFGEQNITNSAFGTYRIWLPFNAFATLTNESPASKKSEFATFIYNTRIIHGVKISHSGEVFINTNNQVVYHPYSFEIQFPDDDLFMGENKIGYLKAPGNYLQNDTTKIRQVSANYLARTVDGPYFNVRLVRFYINGIQFDSIFEDVQTVSEKYCLDAFGTQPSSLFELIPYIEQDKSGFTNFCFADFNIRTNMYGERNIMQYFINFDNVLSSAGFGSYSGLWNLLSLFNDGKDTVYSSVLQYYFSILNEQIDVNKLARVLAFQHVIGNTDSFGYLKGYNSFLYKPQNKKWQLLPGFYRDVFGLLNYSPSANDLFLYNTNDFGLVNLYSNSEFRRVYIEELLNIEQNGLMNKTFLSMISNLTSTLVKEGISTDTANAIINWTQTRKSLIESGFNINVAFTVNTQTNFTTNSYIIKLNGTGPIQMDGLEINSNVLKVFWDNYTNWYCYVPLNQGTNNLVIYAIDENGYRISGQVNLRIVTPPYSTQTNFNDVPLMWTTDTAEQIPYLKSIKPVVINEIMYNAKGAGGDYIEIFNPNNNIYVDLSGWEIGGIGYTFPNGIILGPMEYFVVVQDLAAFTSIYGNMPNIIGQYTGNLNNLGEKISLKAPGKTPNTTSIIEEVFYEPTLPWAIEANGTGASLQRINPYEEGTRVVNWTAVNNLVTNLSISTPGGPNNVLNTNYSIPPLFINEIQTKNENGIVSSTGKRSPWVEIYYSGAGNMVISNTYISDNLDEPMKWQIPDGKIISQSLPLIIYFDGETNSTYPDLHAAFTINTNSGIIILSTIVDGSLKIVDYIRYSDLPKDTSYGSYPNGQSASRQIFLHPTPGMLNSVTPMIVINEWMASNIAAVEDNEDNDFEDWFELYNLSYNPVDLSGYYLTDNLTNKNQFRIPDGTIIPARGFLLVWADAEPWQNKTGSPEIHANFTLSKNGEQIGLFTPDLKLVDGITFGAQMDNISQGRFPDGSTNIYYMLYPTPSAPNVISGNVELISPIETVPGGVVYFQIQASNIPSAYIRYEPGENFPQDAYLDTSRGIFVWVIPANSEVNKKLNFSIRICDMRPGASTINLNISVNILPPIVANITKDKFNKLYISWNSETQRVYQLQYKTNISDLDWFNLTPPLTATSSVITITIPPTNSMQYFRVIKSP